MKAVFENGKAEIEILGAEAVRNEEEEYDLLRIYFRQTNLQEVDQTIRLEFTATQDGNELDFALAGDNAIPEDRRRDCWIHPGVSVISTKILTFDPEGGPVEFSCYRDWSADEKLIVTFDPQNLPGVPDLSESLIPVPEPTWLEGLPLEGDVSDVHIKIEGVEAAETTDPGDGYTYIRVNYTLTNHKAEAKGISSLLIPTNMFQDGMSLVTAYNTEYVHAADDVLELKDDIPAGATVSCSRTYKLINDSPVEVSVGEWYMPAVAGTVFDLP